MQDAWYFCVYTFQSWKCIDSITVWSIKNGYWSLNMQYYLSVNFERESWINVSFCEGKFSLILVVILKERISKHEWIFFSISFYLLWNSAEAWFNKCCLHTIYGILCDIFDFKYQLFWQICCIMDTFSQEVHNKLYILYFVQFM